MDQATEVQKTEIPQERLGPWFTMLTKPRAAIQQIIETNPQKRVFLLASLWGIGHVILGNIKFESLAAFLKGIGITVVLGSIIGIAGLYLSGWLVQKIGKILKGQGTPESVRAALAWSAIPYLWGMLLLVPLGILMVSLMKSLVPVAFITTFIAVWSLVVVCKSVGQVQGFSAWKALLNLLVPGLVMFFFMKYIMLFLM